MACHEGAFETAAGAEESEFNGTLATSLVEASLLEDSLPEASLPGVSEAPALL